MAVWNEADHPRDEEGKFTEKGSGSSAKESYSDKMQRRADILYGSDEEYIKKYYGKGREQNPLKKYEDMELDSLKEKVQEKSIEVAPKVSKNAVFSDDEILKAKKFIHGSEGLRLNAYKDIAGVMTIGYGHTGKVNGKPITEGMRITKEKAEELYRKDFETHIQPLKEIKVPLTSNQKIALSSFIYNVGGKRFKDSNLLKKLNKGDYQGAANEFDIYIKARNPKTGLLEQNKGLINRRKKEKELFLTPDGE